MDAQLIKGLSFLLLQLFMLGIDSGHAQQSVTCDAGTAYIGESSNVTCYYHKDIGKNKLSVNVAMVPTTPEEDKEERDVIQCSWTKQDDKPQCLVADGYTFNREVTDRLTVEIQFTTPHFAGIYSCRIVPPDDATVNTCTLVVKEKVKETCRHETRSSQPGTSMGMSHTTDEKTGTATLILLIILIFLVIGVIVYYAWRKEWIHHCQVLKGVCQEDPERTNGADTEQPNAAKDTARMPSGQSQDQFEGATSVPSEPLLGPDDCTKQEPDPDKKTKGPPRQEADITNYQNHPIPPPRNVKPPGNTN